MDPTAVVAPERLRRGVLDLMPQAFSASERLLYGSPWLVALMQRWDAANAWWSDHIVKFDLASQLDLLARLGIRTPETRYLGWAFMGALLGWLALIGWQLGRGARAARPDALARAYLRLCRKLARAVPPRAAHQGPLEYSHVVQSARPQLRAGGELLARYAQLRYGPRHEATSHARAVSAFARAVARLRVPRRAA